MGEVWIIRLQMLTFEVNVGVGHGPPIVFFFKLGKQQTKHWMSAELQRQCMQSRLNRGPKCPLVRSARLPPPSAVLGPSPCSLHQHRSGVSRKTTSLHCTSL